jgi:hypothetical protein
MMVCKILQAVTIFFFLNREQFLILDMEAYKVYRKKETQTSYILYLVGVKKVNAILNQFFFWQKNSISIFICPDL